MIAGKKSLILIPTLLLIPILLVMTPLNMAHRFANGEPIASAKQCKSCNDHCPFHSIVSHGDIPVGILNSTPSSVATILLSQRIFLGFPEPLHLNTYQNAIPLRC